MNQNLLQYTHRYDETNELYNNINLRIDTVLIHSAAYFMLIYDIEISSEKKLILQKWKPIASNLNESTSPQIASIGFHI